MSGLEGEYKTIGSSFSAGTNCNALIPRSTTFVCVVASITSIPRGSFSKKKKEERVSICSAERDERENDNDKETIEKR